MRQLADDLIVWGQFPLWLLFIYTPVGIGLLFFGCAGLISRIAQCH